MKGFRLLVLAALFAAGCGSKARIPGVAVEETQAKVKDAHFARIPQSGLSEVDGIREEIREQRDRVLRAEHEVAMRGEALAVADAEIRAAEAQLEVAKSSLDLAKKTGETSRIEQAEQQHEALRTELRRAEAQREIANRQQEFANAQLDVIEGEVVAAEARLELAKLQALQEAGDASAENYKVDDFQEAIETAQAEIEKLQDAVVDAEGNIAAAEARLEEMDRVPVRGTEPEQERQEQQ